MNIRVIGVIIIGVLVAAGLAYVLASWQAQEQGSVENPEEQIPQEESMRDFEKVGNLVKDNPGLKSGVWYVVYEEPGAPAIAAELLFENEICRDVREFVVCQNRAFHIGDRVRVQGSMQGQAVRVVDVFFAENVDTKNIRLFYYAQEQDTDEEGNIQCSKQGLAAVERQVAVTQTPAQDAVRLLLRGALTAEEKAQGISTEYPLAGFSLQGATLSNGALTLEFEDAQNKTVGGSCRVGMLWFQIDETVKQFDQVQTVRFIPEELFQP